MLPLKISGALPESVTCPVPEIALGKVTALVFVKVTNPLLVIAVALVGVKPAMASLKVTEESLGMTTVATLPKVGVAPVAKLPVTAQFAPSDHEPPGAPLYVTDDS